MGFLSACLPVYGSCRGSWNRWWNRGFVELWGVCGSFRWHGSIQLDTSHQPATRTSENKPPPVEKNVWPLSLCQNRCYTALHTNHFCAHGCIPDVYVRTKHSGLLLKCSYELYSACACGYPLILPYLPGQLFQTVPTKRRQKTKEMCRMAVNANHYIHPAPARSKRFRLI